MRYVTAAIFACVIATGCAHKDAPIGSSVKGGTIIGSSKDSVDDVLADYIENDARVKEAAGEPLKLMRGAGSGDGTSKFPVFGTAHLTATRAYIVKGPKASGPVGVTARNNGHGWFVDDKALDVSRLKPHTKS
ncbi:hypothetical protein BH09SUM1_BH09SUM1_20990 [soil metagenome]